MDAEVLVRLKTQGNGYPTGMLEIEPMPYAVPTAAE